MFNNVFIVQQGESRGSHEVMFPRAEKREESVNRWDQAPGSHPPVTVVIAVNAGKFDVLCFGKRDDRKGTRDGRKPLPGFQVDGKSEHQ